MSDMEYCKMLEIPVNSCDVIIKPSKKRKKNVVEKVIDKVNADDSLENTQQINVKKLPTTHKKTKKKPQIMESESETVSIKSSKFDIVSIQVVAIFALIIGIILTNIFWVDSGMNNLMRQVFGSTSIKNTATYSSFNPSVPSKSQTVSLDNGIMTVASGSIYSPCDGVVENITLNEDIYTVSIRHSDSFTSVISGLELCYLNVNDTAYGNIPLGYSSNEINVSMFDNDTQITSYVINGEDIVWLT